LRTDISVLQKINTTLEVYMGFILVKLG